MTNATPSDRSYYQKRLSSLSTERSGWFSHWQQISKYLQPVRGRFFISDTNRGESRYNQIIDNTGTRALGILSAGLMAGMTSPARPWFRLATPDPDLMDFAPVKRWMGDVTQILREIFARSNTYRMLHNLYEELGEFGTAAGLVLGDFDNVVRGYALTAGEYYLAQNEKQQVDTIYREFRLTVENVVNMFGEENCSVNVRSLWTNQTKDAWVDIVHCIEPRQERELRRRDAKNMPWRSVYFEKGSEDKSYLRESGFEDFPALTPRWLALGGDIYGRSPGMEALGDVIQLQRSQLMKGKAIDYMADPPVQMPGGMKDSSDTLPGGVSYYNGAAGPDGGIKTAFEVRLELNHLLADIQDTRDRINSAFYADLFLMISQMDTTRTATEIAARQEEKLLMLGPVLERLHNEMLDPLIDLTFAKALRAGILPPPPQELEGVDLKVEYVSMLAQAQRAVGLGSVDRLLGTVGSIAQFKPEALDKLNTDEIIDGYSDMLGVDPDFIVANENVAVIRANRAQQQQQAEATAAVPGAAQAAKTLSETDPEQLQAVVDQFSGL